ncbi:MAG: hypothetical protein WCJ35_27430 [Planctomycetota bacterium]
MPLLSTRLLLLFLALSIAGCAWMTPQTNQSTASILQPTQMAPGSAVIEVFSICLPPGDADLRNRVWDEVDEQHFPSEVRRKLEKNGFRAGILAGQIPPSLLGLMELKGKPSAGGEVQQVKIADLATPSRVSCQRLQTHAGQRYEIAASGMIEKMPILVSELGEIRGVTYEQAQGIFALHTAPQPDGRVQFELVPEIHHGQNRQRWVGDQAIFRLETGRPKRAFEELKLTAVMGPGAVLLLGSRPNRPGSLGHYFFLESNGRDDRLDQKLILVRLCQTQHDDLVSPGPLRLRQ